MSQPRPKQIYPRPTRATTDIQTPLDAAILVAGLRRTWRIWQDRAEQTDDTAVRETYQRAMRDLETLIRDQADQQRAWAAVRADLVAAVCAALRDDLPPPEDPGLDGLR